LSTEREPFFNTDTATIGAVGMQKWKYQRTPKTTTGRKLSSNFATPTLSFPAALRGKLAKEATTSTPGFSIRHDAP
jgi:hypothetical protein